MEFIDVLKNEVHIASLGRSFHIIHIPAKNLAVSIGLTTVHIFFADPVVILAEQVGELLPDISELREMLTPEQLEKLQHVLIRN